jgi:hypothetical protein
VRTILAYLFVALTSLPALASGGNETQGARANSMAGTSVTLVDAWSTTNNPGALGLIDKFSFGMGYETRFFLPEASLRSVAMAAPLGGGTVGLVGHNYGFAGYSDNRVGLSYGRKLSEYISLGVQVNYVQTRIGDVYGSRSTAVGEVGLLIMPSDHIRVGAHLYNPTRAKLADFNDERIPTSLRIGGQYIFSDQVNASFELDKDIDYPVNIKTAIEYQPVDQLFLRAGYATAQNTLAFGFGYRWNGILADVSASWNQQLGYSTTISVGYEFGKRKK